MTKGRWMLLVLAVVIAAGLKKAKSHQESEWQGLTEGEARSKLDAKLPGRIPDEKRSEISDKIVTKMRDHGVIREDSDVDESDSDPAIDLRDSAAEAAEATQN